MTADSTVQGNSAGAALSARRRLRLTAFLFLVLLGIPIAILLGFSMLKLHQQALLQHRFAAEQAADAIQKRIVAAIDQEEARPFNDYSFYTAGSDAFSNSLVQRSTLSQLQSGSSFPGIVGYFQIAPDGSFSSPILPAGWTPGTPAPGIPESELSARVALLVRIEEVLSLASEQPVSTKGKRDAIRRAPPQPRADEKQLVDKEIVDRVNSAKFSQESLIKNQIGRDGDMMLRKSKGGLPGGFGMKDQADDLGNVTKQKLARKEAANTVHIQEPRDARSVSQGLAGSHAPASDTARSSPVNPAPKIVSFEAEVDPFQVLSIPDGHLVFFRKTWRGSQRIIQGAIVEARPFLEGFSEDELSASSLPPGSVLEIKHEGSTLLSFQLPGSGGSSASSYVTRKVMLKSAAIKKSYDNRSSGGKSIFETTLPEPLGTFTLLFTVQEIVDPPGAALVVTLGAVLGIVLVIGTLLLYRLASAQITLAQKRNDFVSAVSHELKTPLTSIRMYGEMLKNDWIPDESKKRTYYDYIFQESERLSRLIGNVLRLSKLSNGNDRPELVEFTPQKLLESLRPKLEQITTAGGFTLSPKLELGADPESCRIMADEDSLSQIAINLVDNAVKFARDAERKEVEAGFKAEESSGKIIFYVRDFGPGVSKTEQRKIFGLFYRSENELTRKTTGTGIGLALVKQLASAMGAGIDYRSRDPGAEFQVSFPRTTSK